MAYKVVITPQANHRLDMYVGYTSIKLKNPEAARDILRDAKETKKRLSVVANNLRICDNPILAKFGYRKINFSRHDYFMVYRLDGKTAIVDGMYHELQDYEALFIDDVKLS